jgi:trehalose/maltose hydrolase-like predicted phosphorylase
MIDILTGQMELHISADVAYAVWQYWRATGDDEFFVAAGAEILLETARFWASRAVMEADGKRHIRHVIGPDEYHEDVDDNAFTNVMGRWNIARALEAIEALRARWPDRAVTLFEKLSLSTLIRNYGDVLRCRNLRALARRFLSLARSACRSRRVKVHLNGLAALW